MCAEREGLMRHVGALLNADTFRRRPWIEKALRLESGDRGGAGPAGGTQEVRVRLHI